MASLPIQADGRLGAATASIVHTGTVADPPAPGNPTRTRSTLTRPIGMRLRPTSGLDKLFVYKFDPSKGSLTPNEPPRHRRPAGPARATSRSTPTAVTPM